MKKFLLITAALAGAVCLVFALAGCDENGGSGSSSLEYTLSDDGTYYICSGIGTCTDTEIEIASRYKNKPVTEIGARAFLNCTGLKSVVIPESVISVGNYAFSGCTSLTEITIPDSVTSISYNMFCDCTRLTSITIPDSVTSIEEMAFYGCRGLTSIIIPDSVTVIGQEAFTNCNKLVYNEYDSAKYLGNDSNPYVVLVKATSTSITSCTVHENHLF